jgi:glycosyltransferase involved in cell wall biosynthesis
MFLYRRAARVVSVTHAFRQTLMRRGIDGGKIDVVTNGVDIGRFSPRPKDAALEAALGWQGRFVAGYIGTHGLAHGLDTLLQAMHRLAEHPEGRDVRLLMLGDGARKAHLQAEAQRLGLGNVRFVDTVPKAEVARYWSLLDVSIIHLQRTELFTTVIPSKLFECMGMGIPVLHGVAGESADIVRREGVGVVFEAENVQELVDGLLELKRDVALRASLRQAGLKAAGHYDRRALAQRMLGVLRDVAGAGGGA